MDPTRFNLSQLNTTVKQEFIGGTTTFMTMAYILFVQPTVLSAAEMDFSGISFRIITGGYYFSYP